jgi:5-methylcytosine-specific restriction enzyme B
MKWLSLEIWRFFVKQLIEIVYQYGVQNWSERNKSAFEELFGAVGGRYPEKAKRSVTLRAPGFRGNEGVPFAAYIHPSNPDSGAYGGMSFVLFPIEDGPCLIAMVVGTQGLSPDEEVLSRPGHARKVAAICAWLNKKYGQGNMLAWAKHDPVRTDLDTPSNIKQLFPVYQSIFERYGRVLYGIFVPNDNREATTAALKAFLDLTFEERGQFPLKAITHEADQIRAAYFSHLMPNISEGAVESLLQKRRFVVLEGPPGTGKTRMALRILNNAYKGNGRSIQFHPNMTYESFIGGLAPLQASDGLGFRFAPQKGFLMRAVEEALKNPQRPFLLHIDEINRSDLSKVLGEAIFLLEPESEEKREINLAHDFGQPFGRQLSLPNNLHILGTMNSADRSIAIVDVAVRRRFAFVKLWPQLSVIQEQDNLLMEEAFIKLLSIFVEHAGDDAISLVPGHSYFLEKDEANTPIQLKVNLLPLLEEYLAQGYVSGFSDSVQAYSQWIESLQT